MSNIVAVLHTTDFRGDHETDIQVLFEIKPDETVEALYQRIKDVRGLWKDHSYLVLQEVRPHTVPSLREFLLSRNSEEKG